ncbi:MAG: hypothetical protein WAN82_06280 [Candidatus Bathyarchaeia archaeon]
MFKNFRDKIALSGITVLMIGVALLIGTFVSAYGFLTQSPSIIASEDLVRTFGEALAPLIATCIRIMYLGVMGWIGSLLTIRGVTIIAHTPQMPTVVPQKPIPAQQKPLLQKAKAEKPQEEAKPEAKPSEPEFVVIPPEQVSQPQPEPKEPQKNDSSPQPSNH